MSLLIGIRKLGKDRIFALISFVAGLVFCTGIFIPSLCSQEFSWTYPLEQLGKITFQSNLVALFTSGLYFFKPNHRFFRRNLLLLFTTTLLCFAGIGFWCLLFPLYYIDLGSLIISTNEPRNGTSMFYVVWNHTITQFFFLLFFQQLHKRRDFSYLVPIETRQMIKCMLCYTVLWVFYNMLASFVLNTFPTYGVLTNFNPYSNFKNQNTNTTLFNVRFLIISHLFCCLLICVLSWYFSLWSIKLRAVNAYSVFRKSKYISSLN